MRRRGADDEVLDEADLEELSGFDELFRDDSVGSAGRGIARRVVVDEDKAIGFMENHWLEAVSRVSDGFIDGAAGEGDKARCS